MLDSFHTKLNCTQELSIWNRLTDAIAQQHLHNWSNISKLVRQIISEMPECENNLIDINTSLLELLTHFYIQNNEFSNALKVAQELLKLLLNKNDEQDGESLFNVYGLFGQILLNLNNNHAAELAFKKQLDLAEMQKLDRFLLIAHSNLTIFYTSTDNQQMRYNHLFKTLFLLKKCDSKTKKSVKWFCLRDYAEMLKDCGYLIKALLVYERVLMITQENGLSKEEATICCQIAELNSQLNNCLEAWPYYQHALSILSNLPYKDLALNCIEKCVDLLEQQLNCLEVDEQYFTSMLIYTCNECLKFGFDHVAQQILFSTFKKGARLNEINGQLINLIISLFSDNKTTLVCIFTQLLTYSFDPLILNLLLKTLIELGDYKEASNLYLEWKHIGFGYLETLMMSCVDRSLSLNECAEMALKLDADTQVAFLDLFSLYKYLNIDFCEMVGPEARLHWLIYQQKTEEIELQVDYYEKISTIDKLLAVLIGSDIKFDIDFVYTPSVCRNLSTDDFNLLTALCALFYFDRPLESLYCLEQLRFIHLQKEAKQFGLKCEKWKVTKEQSTRIVFEQDPFCYCFRFGSFEFAWIGEANNLQLVYCHRHSTKLTTFHESMLQIISNNLQLVEFNEKEFEQHILQFPLLINSRKSKSDKIDFHRHQLSLLHYLNLPTNQDYNIGCLLIGNVFNDDGRFKQDGFITFPIRSGTFKNLISAPQISSASIVFADTSYADTILLLKNKCQPELLVVIGNNAWDSCLLKRLLFSRAKITVQVDTVDQINKDFIDLVICSLNGLEFGVEDLQKIEIDTFRILSNLPTNNKLSINCPAARTRNQICRVLKSGEKLKLDTILKGALKDVDRKELLKCQKSSMFKRILINTDLQAINEIEPEQSTILKRIIFSDYFYGTKSKMKDDLKAKVSKLASFFDEEEKVLRQSSRSQRFKSTNQKLANDYEKVGELSEESDVAKVLDVSLPF